MKSSITCEPITGAIHGMQPFSFFEWTRNKSMHLIAPRLITDAQSLDYSRRALRYSRQKNPQQVHTDRQTVLGNRRVPNANIDTAFPK